MIPLVAQAQAEQSADSDTPMQLPKIIADILTIKDVVIDVKNDSTAALLTIEQLQLTYFNAWLQQPILVALSAEWNKAPITLSLVAKPWDEVPSVDTQLKINDLSLDSLASFIGQSMVG